MEKIYNLFRNYSAALMFSTVFLSTVFFVPTANAHSYSIFSSSNARPFDFSDSFYLRNGVIPA